MADPLFLARYVENVGSDALDMIASCRALGSPDPVLKQRLGPLWRDWLKGPVTDGLGLNERQNKAMVLFRQVLSITNAAYQEVTGASRATAKHDLDELISKGVLMLEGHGGGARYTKMNNWLINGSNGSVAISPRNEVTK